MKTNRLILFLGVCLLLAQPLMAQSRRDKEQTYILEHPYAVKNITFPKGKKVKNVILMIGDGMSLMDVYAAWTANRGHLYLEQAAATGLSKTYCTDKLITDSGAGGTALATGQKTSYHSVGVDPSGKPLRTLIDFAADRNQSSGIVVSCRLNDATPADFCCHNTDRDKSYAIVADYVTSGVDFVFGGGAKFFMIRPDGRNLFEELQAKGYATPRSMKELKKVKSGKVFAVTQPVDLPVPKERKDMLAQASLKAIDILNQNKNGFFLMVEGSQLDDYGHFNDLDMLMQEVHDFDRTVGRILEWAAQDGETLVVVTADHETGGLTLVDGDLEQGKIVCKFSTCGHSGVMVPVYAFGPGAESFTGIYENTAVFDKIQALVNSSATIPSTTAATTSCTSASSPATPLTTYNLPYKNTYIMEALVTENEYRVAKPVTTIPGTFEQAKEILPLPYWEGHEDAIEMYWKAWEIAVGNIKAPLPGSGFVSSYLDTAYNGNIFMWDSAFITMFARYGTRFFNFQQTIDNFYAKQHPDGFICREIKADGADCFERYDPTSTGPNILPWSEMVYYKQFGDRDRLNKVFPVLCAYYKWLKLNRTWQNGTYWSSGWGTGMDNMPRVPSGYNKIYSNGHMVWLDACLQQLYMSNLLLEMGLYLERWQEIEEFEDESEMLKNYINTNMWDEKANFLFDQYADGSLSTTKGIYAYWALLTDVLSTPRLDKLVQELKNPATFNRTHRVPSLAANHPKYKANGRYWQGGVWPSSNYMVITGLYEKGYRKESYAIALNHYNNVLSVYNKTHTFWEYYSPEAAEPGFMARKDFVGWTGLPPIAGLIEQLFGIHSSVFNKTMTLDVNLLDAYGIARYPYGKEGVVAIKVHKRRSSKQEPVVEVESNVSFKLTIRWGNQSKEVTIKDGKQIV